MLKIKTNSKLVEPGDTFVAIKGNTVDGHQYIEEAINKGARFIVAEHGEYKVPTLIVKDTTEYLRETLSKDYSKDFKDLKNMKSEDYIRYVDKMAGELNNSIYDAMKSQGMTAQLGNDSANLSRLANQVYSAEGQQQVLQTMANISAVNGQQLIRMQKMMADTNKVQMQYLEQKVQEEKLAKEKTKNIYNKSQKWGKK